MATNIVYQGAASPEDIRVTITQGDSGLNLTTVTAVEFDVRLPDGSDDVWSASIVSATTTELVSSHVFSPADTVQLGTYVMLAKLTVPGGFRRTIPKTLEVLDPFALG